MLRRDAMKGRFRRRPNPGVMPPQEICLLNRRLPIVMATTVTNQMFISLVRKEVTRSNAACFGAFFFGAVIAMHAAPGAEATAATNPPSAQVQTVYLEHSEVGYSFISRGLPLAGRTTPFAKEPAFAGGKVVRGTFQPGGSASNAIAFAWDRAAGKLYLDLNRNLNFTDDPAGVFECPDKAYSKYYQTFTNIHLSGQTPSGNREWLVDLNLYNYGSRPGCTAAMRSFEQGRVTLQGADWQVGIVENPFDASNPLDGSFLLLRPWAARNESFSTSPGSSVTVPLPRKLFFQDQAWRLDCTNEWSGNNARLRLQFAPEQPALGELKVAGDFIQRLTLQNGPYLVVLDRPGPVARVPVGRYSQPGVWLKQGDAEAYRETGYLRSEKGIAVDEKKPAMLTAGGPLTNSLIAGREGKNLRFNYRLLGAGGEVYQLTRQDRSHPPEFAVYQGDRKIASGKFAFG
jgi:hypothetical protein